MQSISRHLSHGYTSSVERTRPDNEGKGRLRMWLLCITDYPHPELSEQEGISEDGMRTPTLL